MNFTAKFRYIKNITSGGDIEPVETGIAYTFKAKDLAEARSLVKQYAYESKLPEIRSISVLRNESNSKRKMLSVYVQDPLIKQSQHVNLDVVWKKPKGPRGPQPKKTDVAVRGPKKVAKKAAAKKPVAKAATVAKKPAKKVTK